jgi:23S rRNA (uracil1939-C5)-methyltransferase
VSLIPDQRLELSIEKPAAGGRMIARHDRQVVLVQGAIPGERVVARIERVDRQLAFADTVQVIDASPDRTATAIDALCGGCLYAHIAYPRQLALKGEIIQDAFARLGRIPLGSPVSVAASPDRAYRMRARLHAREGRIGFYREGTHELCDAVATGQLSDAAVSSAQRAVESLLGAGCSVSSVELTENIAADERVMHVTVASGSTITDAILDSTLGAGGLTGCTARTTEGTLRTSGVPVVSDSLIVLTTGRARGGVLQRHAESFFQANRFLLPHLVTTVLDGVGADGGVLDLYAGVGLFAVSLGACGVENVTAVEADHSSGADLQRNVAMNGATVRVGIASVEDFLRRRKGPSARTIVADPPRTGMSKEAMQAVVRHQAARVLYVSCDPPTMARDARRLVDGGYRLTSLTGLDLFPNTPHVETVGVFDRTV